MLIQLLQGGMKMKMTKGSLSLCIIAKNEEDNISRCIGSCEHIVDEIIVVDTGSKDNTIKIAQSLGAKVISIPWENDFSKARNKAVKAATCEWILYLDCDEVLDFEGSFELKELLASEETQEGQNEGFCLNLINVVDNQKTLNYASLRIFRNRPEYEFRGRIHEQIFPSISEKYSEDAIKVLGFNFYHYGYDKNLSDIESKKKRNIEIFNSYEESEKDGFFYYNLANEYTRSGDSKKAIENYLLARTTPAYDNGFKLFLPVYLTKSYYDLKDYSAAIAIGLEYLEEYPTFKDLNFIVAVCYYESGNYVKCKEYIMKYIDLRNQNYGFPEFYLDSSNDLNALLRELDSRINQ